ncbi:hypothetical protein JVT61DRAFT_11200 [Boletus reticuloceps]|uniref:Alcohol dehydrogenase-like C-terminal domain-containing protein n=1 Tax=Boletus reticuloceps TaxID=495285 RepID=A0A8I2YF09_9AGAM|nr:hypothetical protein JVT61DRAFT_11200 [Boletus reticuloceps]
MVKYGQVNKGDDVLVHAGASGVGGRSNPDCTHTVTATASTRDKLEWLLSIPNGATHAVNYTSDNFAEHVKQTTKGKGVDVIIDFVGRTHWKRTLIRWQLTGGWFSLHS